MANFDRQNQPLPNLSAGDFVCGYSNTKGVLLYTIYSIRHMVLHFIAQIFVVSRGHTMYEPLLLSTKTYSMQILKCGSYFSGIETRSSNIKLLTF